MAKIEVSVKITGAGYPDSIGIAHEQTVTVEVPDEKALYGGSTLSDLSAELTDAVSDVQGRALRQLRRKAEAQFALTGAGSASQPG